MNCESSIENTNNLDKQSHHSSDEVSSTGGSSGCDSDGEISWSSEAEINYQRSNYALRSLQVEKIDKNDTSANDDVENDDQELSLWNSDSIRDSELTSDSDEEFAIHPCLQGLIKSKSVSSIQKNDYTTFTLCNGDQFANTQSLSEEETSASSVPYFSRSRIVRDYRASVCKTRSNARVSDNWSAPGNNTFKDGIGFESDDDLDQARSSPFTCCWSAPEFIGDNEQETSEELSSSEDASFVAGNLLSEKSQHASVPCADLSEYDEPMRTSILDFSGPASMQIDDLPRPNPRYQKSCPRAISENDSLCIYDASPSLHGDDDDDEMDFVDELPEIEHTKINKWTPEGLINFAKETFRESTEANEQLLENRPKISNISKSLGSLDLWETEMGWITRVPSPVDNIRMALRQSISCHDHMITSYVDCVIQNHYNRCSSPGCRKYASKPEIMKQSMNSGSDTSDDEWIRCVDEITALEESFGNDHIRREVYDQVTASLLSQRNDSNLYATYQHISDLYTDSSREIDKTKMECEEEDVIVKRPIKLLIELEKLTDDEMITIEDDHCNDECLSYREKNQYSSTTDQHTKRSYSLNNLQQLSETLVDSGKELFLFKTKISDMEVEQHFVEIRNLSKFDQHDTYYSNIYHSKLNTEYGSDESDENYDNDNDNDNGSDAFVDRILPVKTNKLPNFYEFTFDVKKSNSNEIKKLPSLHPFGDNNNKSDLGEQILDASYSTVTLWDDCCEYAQQINEIARIWLQKPINDSNTEELISDQAAAAALTICPKSGDLAKLTLETVELDKRRLPLSPPPINVLPGGFVAHSPSSTASVHRRLPPLPIKSSSSGATSLAVRFNSASPMSANLFSPSTIISNSGQPVVKEDHRICFGTDSVMGRSVLLLEDSYYEDNSLNDNQLSSRKILSQFAQEDSSGVSSCCTGSEQFNPTHRVHSSFIPRHDDEVLLEIGDAVHVERECEDHWCYGTNLRTNQHGIFPSAHVCEIDLVEEICMGVLPSNVNQMMTNERDTFYLTMLASIEVAHHKGNDVLVQAMNKVLGVYQNKEEIIVPQTVLMEVSFRGIHIIDKRRKNFFQCPTFDFFYSLQNISFCGAHPKQLRYFGFITKHPLLPRFACHVFLSNVSAQPIVESIGRAFKRSYDEYMAFAHPTEDIYLE